MPSGIATSNSFTAQGTENICLPINMYTGTHTYKCVYIFFPVCSYAYIHVYVLARKQVMFWFSHFSPQGLSAGFLEVQAWHTSFISWSQIYFAEKLHRCMRVCMFASYRLGCSKFFQTLFMSYISLNPCIF